MNKKNFSLCVIAAFILLIVIAGSFALALSENVISILESPAATTNITIDELTIYSHSDYSSINVTVNGFSVQANSKIIDLIILAAQ